MTKAKMCECGHSKSSHSNGNRCEWDDGCNQFRFKELLDVINRGNRINDNDGIPTATYEPLYPQTKSVGRFKISECNEHGIPIGQGIKCKRCKKICVGFASFHSHKAQCRQGFGNKIKRSVTSK